MSKQRPVPSHRLGSNLFSGGFRSDAHSADILRGIKLGLNLSRLIAHRQKPVTLPETMPLVKREWAIFGWTAVPGV